MRHTAIPIWLIAGLLALTTGCEIVGRKKPDSSSRQAYYLLDGPVEMTAFSDKQREAQVQALEQCKLEQEKLKSQTNAEE
ncbi:MAG: hypothetical protein NT013_09610 [Planctomycetia bacterium]|nr:hypothetical protein [Planctomycetia bacterium]